jgi:molecular chaperone GrpE
MKKKEDKNIRELKNQLARALADYDNLRKRTELERKVWIKFASERILISLLPVLDNLEAALKHLKDQGLAIAVGEFKKIFNEEGLEEISPKVGDKFDHELHEAVETKEGGEKGTIAEIILNGWKFQEGKVIRFAKVKVYK